MSIGVGGYFHADVSIRSYGFVREGKIIFSGSTALDNGLSVGVNVRLPAVGESA